MRDFIVSVSDRRSELWGNAWTGRLPSSQLPRPDDEITDPVESFAVPTKCLEALIPAEALEAMANLELLPFADRLTTLLGYSVLPLRYEPLNPVTVHRGVASPGALYPLNTYLLMPSGQRREIFQLHPFSRRLAQIGSMSRPDDQSDGGSFRIIATGSFTRCSETYGPFGIFLMALEAGMVAAQWQLIATRLGFHTRCVPPSELEAGGPLLETLNWSELALSACDFMTRGGHDLAYALRDGPHEMFPPTQTPTASAGAPGSLRPTLDIMRRGRARTRTISPVKGGGVGGIRKFPLFSATMRRGSGLPGNRSPREWTDESLTDLLNDVRRLGLTIGLTSGHPAFAAVALSRGHPDAISLFEFRVDSDHLLLLHADAKARDAARSMSGGRSAILATLGYDDVSALTDGGGDLLTPHVEAGRLAHCFCLAAASAGASARPYKAHADRQSNVLLPLRYRTLLQIIITYDASANPAFTL